jgi:rod shape-determining protein MreD
MFSAVLFDGFIASYGASTLDTNIGLVVPRTIILVIIILTFHYQQNFMLGSAAVIGFIMDAYYLGFLGVYMAAFILVVTLVSNLKQVIYPNVLSYTLLSILGITAAELVVYSIMRLLSITTLSFQMFLVSRLSATLLFNGLAMLLFSYFIHQLIVNTLDES